MANFAARASLSASIPRAFPAELLAQAPLFSAHIPGRAFTSQVQDLAFVPVEYFQVLDIPLLLLSRNPWLPALASSVSPGHSPQCGVTCEHDGSIPHRCSRSLIKTGPRRDPCGTPHTV